jgi:hypothetical protein
VKLLAIAILVASELGFMVQAPAGWTEDAEASAELRTKTKSSFFAGTPVEVDATVFRAPDDRDTTFVIQVLTMNRSAGTDTLELWATHVDPAAKQTRRTAGDARVIDIENASDTYQMRGTFHVVGDGKVEHAITAVCNEKRGGTACAPAIASVGIGEPDDDNSWWYWVAIAGAFLVSIGLVGWRIELRRRR